MEGANRGVKERRNNVLAFLGRVTLGFSLIILIEFFMMAFESAWIKEPLINVHDPTTDIVLLVELAAILIGLFLTRTYMFETTPITISDGFFMVALAWLVVSLLASIPYLAVSFPQARLEPYKAIFEAVSGITATGLTAYSNVEVLPESILFWRSLTEWIGGLGVVTMFLGFIIHRVPVAMALYRGEGRESESIRMGSVIELSKRITMIYVALTLLAIALFRIFGMSTFDAINHAMTAIATGGFSTKNNSLAGYSVYLHYSAIFIMFLGAISFDSHLKVFQNIKNLKRFFNMETVLLILLPAMFTALYGVVTFLRGEASFLRTHDYLFTAVSAITGTGFSVTNVANYSDLTKLTIILLMVIGGCYGSTSSALKILRIIILVDVILWLLKKSSYPSSAIVPLRILGRQFRIENVVYSLLYSMIYLISLFVASLAILLFTGNSHGFVNVLFEVASAQGNVGLSVGVSGSHMPVSTAIVLIIVMLLGRLEITPWIVFIHRIAMMMASARSET
ncbi:MAG: TrkH family potassium uptake protein [Euryarchaeota archaeon]|nr:TrkH family potassium uptake protein [Euryarchaeota archaeon]